MPTGTVKFYNESKGFGFIIQDDRSPDLFFHKSDLEHSGIKTINEGARISYAVFEKNNGKLTARNISLL